MRKIIATLLKVGHNITIDSMTFALLKSKSLGPNKSIFKFRTKNFPKSFFIQIKSVTFA